MNGYDILQNSAAYPLVFLMVSNIDHLLGKTGLSPTVTISKNGGAFGAPAGAVSEIGNGWYKVAGNATDSNTLGPIVLNATGTGADPTDSLYPVVSYNPQSATSLGLSNLDAAITSRMATYTQPAGFLAATFPAGTVANTTNITGGVITTTTNLTTNNDKTGYTMAVGGFPVGGFAAGAITDAASAADFENAIRDAVWAKVLEAQGSYTAAQIMSLILAACAGVTDTGGVVFRTPNGIAIRITATVDAGNNRTGMVLTP